MRGGMRTVGKVFIEGEERGENGIFLSEEKKRSLSAPPGCRRTGPVAKPFNITLSALNPRLILTLPP